MPGAMPAKEPEEAHTKESRADSALLVALEPLEPAVAEVHVPWDFSVILALKCSLLFFFCLSQLELSYCHLYPKET